jgi:hypothetical protein
MGRTSPELEQQLSETGTVQPTYITTSVHMWSDVNKYDNSQTIEVSLPVIKVGGISVC